MARLRPWPHPTLTWTAILQIDLFNQGSRRLSLWFCWIVTWGRGIHCKFDSCNTCYSTKGRNDKTATFSSTPTFPLTVPTSPLIVTLAPPSAASSKRRRRRRRRILSRSLALTLTTPPRTLAQEVDISDSKARFISGPKQIVIGAGVGNLMKKIRRSINESYES